MTPYAFKAYWLGKDDNLWKTSNNASLAQIISSMHALYINKYHNFIV